MCQVQTTTTILKIPWLTISDLISAPLNDDDYDLAMKHVRFLLDSDLENEAARQGANEVMWAVFAAFIK